MKPMKQFCYPLNENHGDACAYFVTLQESFCESQLQFDCVANISVTEDDCPPRCDGIILGLRQDSVGRRHLGGFTDLLNEYDSYKCRDCPNIGSDQGVGNTLHFVRIFFDTSTFQRITKVCTFPLKIDPNK